MQAWQQVVLQEDQWHAHRYEGFRPVACDLVGFFRPRLSGCFGKHYQSGADKALPAIVLAVVAAVGSVGKVRLPLVRLLLRAEPGDGREAALQRRAITQAGAPLHPDEVLVVDAGFGVAALSGARVARWPGGPTQPCPPPRPGAARLGGGSALPPTKEDHCRHTPRPPRVGGGQADQAQVWDSLVLSGPSLARGVSVW